MNSSYFAKRFSLLVVFNLAILFVLCACAPTGDNAHGGTSLPVPDGNEETVFDNLVSNGGSYAGDGNYIFYINTNDGASLYRMTQALTDRLRLDDTVCSTLFWDGEYVYYNSMIRDASMRTSLYPALCRIRPDGSERTELVKEAYIDGVAGEWIVFRDSAHNLKRIRKDGTEETMLLANAIHHDYMKVTPDYIFWSDLRDDDAHGLYRANIDGSDLVKLSNDYATWTNIFDNKIYYADGSGALVVTDIDGNSIKTIAEGDFGRILVTSDWIYYSDYAAGSKNLCQIRHDGTEKTVLFEGNVSQISAIRDTVFFTSYTPLGAASTDGYLFTDYCIQSDGSNLRKLTD